MREKRTSNLYQIYYHFEAVRTRLTNNSEKKYKTLFEENPLPMLIFSLLGEF